MGQGRPSSPAGDLGPWQALKTACPAGRRHDYVPIGERKAGSATLDFSNENNFSQPRPSGPELVLVLRPALWPATLWGVRFDPHCSGSGYKRTEVAGEADTPAVQRSKVELF